MIQRIQSIYLFLAAVLSGGLVFLFPIFTKGDKLITVTNDVVFLAMFAISAALSLYTIFQFKKRQLQVVLGRLNVILNFILFGIILYTYFSAYKEDGSLGLGSFVPVLVVILISLANRSVMSDEALIKAADRLR